MCAGKNSEQQDAVPVAASPTAGLPCEIHQTLESGSCELLSLSLLVCLIFISFLSLV